jgi:hypothetical protein
VNLVDPRVDEYAEQHTTPSCELLVELLNLANGSVPDPSGTLAALPNTR